MQFPKRKAIHLNPTRTLEPCMLNPLDCDHGHKSDKTQFMGVQPKRQTNYAHVWRLRYFGLYNNFPQPGPPSISPKHASPQTVFGCVRLPAGNRNPKFLGFSRQTKNPLQTPASLSTSNAASSASAEAHSLHFSQAEMAALRDTRSGTSRTWDLRRRLRKEERVCFAYVVCLCFPLGLLCAHRLSLGVGRDNTDGIRGRHFKGPRCRPGQTCVRPKG